ncbi:UNVERIFIED_CONTAM: hypothetical protein Sradi_6938200 [Sesamum radiatum]|uniref:Uncharacterized protein n=1 Tax=Sesamum radiatum TaxID=300843 RepID=A0AAW2JGN8_SESRA
MAISHNGGSEGSFEGNTSHPSAAGSTVPPPSQTMGGLNVSAPSFNPRALPTAADQLFYE